MKKLKTMLKTEYEKTLTENKKAKNFSASHVAGKLLIRFFALIFIFTFVSRAGASITVARVTISNPQRDKLEYAMSGTGEIVPEAEKRLMVLPGYRIDDVYVKVGKKVDVGTVLYAYSMEDIQDKYTSVENEIKKIKLLIAEERLRQQPSETKLSKSAILSLKQVKENLKVAIMKLDEAQKDYEISRKSTKEKLLENKKKEYEAAMKSDDTLAHSQKKQLMLSGRAVEDAKTALAQTDEKKYKIDQLINKYKEAVLRKDRLSIYLAEEDIFGAFYGGVDAYEEHKDAIYSKASEVMGKGQYLWILQSYIKYYEEYVYEYQEDLQKLQNSTDPTVNSEQSRRALNEKYKDELDSYFSYLEQYEQRLDIMEDAYDKESGELRGLRRNDKRLRDYLTQFNTSIADGTDSKAQEKKLYDYVYGDKQKDMEQEVKKKTLALTRAEEDDELLRKEFEGERDNLQAEKTELLKVIKSMEDGTYDYEEALEGKKKEVEAAQEAVRIAKQAVETQSLVEAEPDVQNSKQISELILQSDMIDLDIKKQELKEISVLMEDSGKVRSPKKGMVTSVGIEPGKMTTGEEMIRLGFGDYVFKAEFDREDATNIAKGVKANISLAGKRKVIEAEIKEITNKENGTSEMMVSMPKDEYILGEKGEFNITTQSEQFDQCIPIQALREDNYGNYVLITQEQEDILGTLLIAERVNITILDKGSRTVAIDGAISSKSQVITDSNKNINAGDRVRIDY